MFREGNGTRRDRWWFLISGEEDALKQLENEWERISIQTNWKLELCTMPASSNKNDGSEAEPTPTGSLDQVAANPSEQSDESTPTNTETSSAQCPPDHENGESGLDSHSPPSDSNFLVVEGVNQTPNK